MAALGATETIGPSRSPCIPPTGKGCTQMLEWRPRLTALLVVVVLVTAAFVTGFWWEMNWEW